MPNTTSPYSIAYPIASDSIAPLHTAFQTMADSVNTAFTNYVKPLTDGQQSNSYIVSSVAGLSTIAGKTLGSLAFVSANKSTYQWDGNNWILMYQPWTDFSSTLKMYDGATTQITTGFTINTARYTVINNMVTVEVKLTIAATAPTFTTGLYSGTPITGSSPLDNNILCGSGTFYKVGTALFPINIMYHNADRVRLLYLSASPTKMSDMKTSPNTNPAAFVSGNIIVFNYTYSL